MRLRRAVFLLSMVGDFGRLEGGVVRLGVFGVRVVDFVFLSRVLKDE